MSMYRLAVEVNRLQDGYDADGQEDHGVLAVKASRWLDEPDEYAEKEGDD